MSNSSSSKGCEHLQIQNELDGLIIPKVDFDFDGIRNEAANLTTKKEEVGRLVSFIDLTTLSGDDTRARVSALTKMAIKPVEGNPEIKCASVCVYPSRILDAKEAMEDVGIFLPIASVAAGFPSGQYHLESRLKEIELAIRDGAQEIDAVISRAAVLDGQWAVLFDEIKQMKGICSKKAKLKIILSVGELGSDENIYKASMVAMLAGVDFIKTSTGKEVVNETMESAFLMCHAIKCYFTKTKRKVGFKAAGGIRKTEEAMQYKLLVERKLGRGWDEADYFRIGASQDLLENIRVTLQGLI